MNNQKLYTQDSAPHVTVTECAGNLIVRSWAETAVSARGDAVEITEDGNSYTVSSHAALELRVPEKTQLTITQAGQDVVVKFVSGSVTIGEAHQDVILSGIRTAKIETIHNDISAKNIDEALHIETVHGDASIRRIDELNIGSIHGDLSARYVNNGVQINEAMGDVGFKSVSGDVSLQQGHRDITLKNVAGAVNVTTHGDIRVYGSLSAADHTLTADQDIIMRWPAGADLNLVANAPTVKNRLSFDKLVENEDGIVGSIGDGQVNVTAKANGRILLKDTDIVDARWEIPDDTDGFSFDFAFDLEGLGNQIKEKFNAEIGRFSEEIESKLGPDFGQELSNRIAQKMEQAAAKAERAAERAARQAERAAERATAQAERSANRNRARMERVVVRRSPGRPPGTGKAAQDAPKPDTTEEKLKILKMVEQGTITPDEAAMLLEALSK